MESQSTPSPQPSASDEWNAGFQTGWRARYNDHALHNEWYNEGYNQAFEEAFQKGFQAGFRAASARAHTPSLAYWVANWNLNRATAAQALGGNVADMIDATHDAVASALAAYPAVKRFAFYITGTPDIQATAEDFGRIPKDCAVLSIDQSNANTPDVGVVHYVKDVEGGASTVGTAVEVARQRHTHGIASTIYCSQADLTAVEDQVAAAGLPHGEIVAYQWASPTSNPNTRVPGTRETLAEANVDLSVVRTDWMRLPQA